MWALEYGAGFAHTALAFARMGVNVDTVDISSTFCGYVKEQADFFNVSLTPFKGLFGDNPRGDQKYDLIWFYESFHHCVDFRNVIQKLKNHLTPDGRILLAGEPIAKRENPAVPYPWGLRLESEVVAVIRNRRWFELGFSEYFLTTLFVNNGYVAEYFDCPMSIFGQVYSFVPRPTKIELGKYWAPDVDEGGWHAPEPMGRWTREHAAVILDQTDNFEALEITATNHHPNVHPVTITYGDVITVVDFRPGERKSIRIDAGNKAPRIVLSSRTIVPAPATGDTRALGIYVHSLEYV
jgi:SAM-dependent methyltransferase